jgi:ribosomal protein S18 acetylase RimI-like enzyme
MARKLRSLALSDFDQLPLQCGSCAFWESAGERLRKCGSVCDPELQEAWYRQVTDEWGECGRVAREDDEVLGFIKYAPSGYFPQASTFAAAPQDPTVPLIACLHIDPDARHHGLGSVLLRAALKDLIGRGERKVEAFAAARRPEVIDDSPVLGFEFLSRNGFVVTRPDPHFPLMRLDLRSIVSWSENLETVLNSLRFPTRAPNRAPASWTDAHR